jgi:hypothetical protein
VPDTPFQFTVLGWSTYHDEARKALQGMSKTHRVNPLPAYDTQNKIIIPASYRLALAGAWVKLEFTLKHWAFAARAAGAHGPATTAYDMFIADIDKIFVLASPASDAECEAPVQESKRKFEQFDSMLPSPKKQKKSAS